MEAERALRRAKAQAVNQAASALDKAKAQAIKLALAKWKKEFERDVERVKLGKLLDARSEARLKASQPARGNQLLDALRTAFHKMNQYGIDTLPRQPLQFRL